MGKFNLRVYLNTWFDYKEDDNSNRPVWIERWLSNYKNGKWSAGEGELK